MPLAFSQGNQGGLQLQSYLENAHLYLVSRRHQLIPSFGNDTNFKNQNQGNVARDAKSLKFLGHHPRPKTDVLPDTGSQRSRIQFKLNFFTILKKIGAKPDTSIFSNAFILAFVLLKDIGAIIVETCTKYTFMKLPPPCPPPPTKNKACPKHHWTQEFGVTPREQVFLCSSNRKN